MRRLLVVFAVAIIGFTARTGGAKAPGSGGTKVPPLHEQADSREVRLTLNEGTSMAAALSPDGRTIVIDLLGALWTMSGNGGRATRILEDGYDARMPAWSPDGQRIAFQAYRSSTWNIWTMSRDGSGLRQETSGPFDDREPHWSPDGARIAFSSDRSGNYDVWTLTLATGELRQITSNPANDFMPAWSPDGREIAFVSDRPASPKLAATMPSEGGRGIYAAAVGSGTPSTPLRTSERLVRADTRTAASPSWSPDGKTVTYTAFEGATSHLVSGGANIADANEDVFPFRAQWRSANDVLYTADGKIKTRSFDSAQGKPASRGPARTIEFSAEVAFMRAAFTPKRHASSSPGPQPVRGVMHPAISPDGAQVVFAALGDLWLVPTSSAEAAPQRITNDSFIDTDPAWSPDGTRIAFSTDRDGSMDLWIRDMRSGAERKIAPRAMSATWSPDNTRIAFLDPESQLQIVDVASGQVRKAHDRLNEPGRPSWSPDGRAIVMGALRPYSTRFREGTNQILRVAIDDANAGPAMTERPRVEWFNPLPHKSIGMREDFGPVWSPDGTQMAAIIDGHLAAFPVARDGSPLGPPRRLSQEIANSPSWTRDSRRLLYQSADALHIVDAIDGTTRTIVPRFSWTAKTAAGTTTLHAGRVFDGRSAAPREKIDIVFEGNRITRVEPHRTDLHNGTVVDASNGTVLPGLIESHTHMSKGYGEPLGRIWLSFGITSVRNPAANPYEGQEDREAIESGARIGPRVFATGEPFDGTRIYYPGGTALDGGTQLTAQLARAQKLNFDLIKTYVRLPDLLQKRIVEEAHRIGIPVTSHEIYPAVAYGADGVEHIRGTSRRGYSPKMSELRRSYRDVIDLLAVSKMTLTPTIGIQGGYQLLTLRDGSWLDDERLRRLFPASALDAARALRKRPADARDLAQRDAIVSPQEKMVAAVVKSGGRVIAGTDSPINPYGLTLLLELEHYVRGGLSPADAIRTATIVPAEAMGLAADLGTIEPGKLADLVVVDGNPLANISDIRRTRYTIKAGVVYEVDALLRGPARATISSPMRR
jgi:Tol biopolymer transport system component/imidazolonepropionase-like amidohydrolase